jgi:mRNA-degrading endonuclease RelE of RelBE toxin-antitoxin system
MKTQFEISDQVLDFVRSLAPEPRRSLRLAFRALAEDAGDIKQLEGDLAGWCRLRVKSYRVIFRYEMVEDQRFARCVFAERRELVYELFAEVMKRLLEP